MPLLLAGAATSSGAAGSAAEALASAAAAAGVSHTQATAFASLAAGRPVCAMLDVDLSELAGASSSGSGGSSAEASAYDLGAESLFAEAAGVAFEVLELMVAE